MLRNEGRNRVSTSSLFNMLGTWGLLLAFVFAAVKADLVVYSDDVLPSPWQDWSWGSTINYDATDLAEGSSSISVTSDAYSALSLYNPTPFPSYVGLSFDISVREYLLFHVTLLTGNTLLGRPTGPIHPASGLCR